MPEDIYIPVLPVRAGKLYFPVGEFSGVWTGEELQAAEKQGAIVNITEAIVWSKSYPIFKTFIQKMEYEKNNSTGARRAFFKLIQNSLYGKFGMRRERDTYMNDTPENRAKILKRGGKFLTIILACGKTMLLTTSRSYASYIQPQISSYITSLARLELFKVIDKYKDSVCYYDTDSIILTRKLAESMIDNQEYGKWKLEGEVSEAVFIQPKMYAEKLKSGKEVLKSKGLIRQEVEKLSYKSYMNIMEKIKTGAVRIEMYSGVESRQKFITSIIKGEDVDTAIYLRKSLNLRQSEKREIDYLNNTSKPLVFKKSE
ncbi:MAG: hypothetical protein DDT42_02071 [candidate division WS2 bacterium]|uniref:DNA-directed DNA polymerase n=1 Tax=Psychracetigena formicireducens TaxID=2986056 RepID=A0A9E2F249_PSYF1|nr:hypothetical protein [Candidatus Psychracetigena formicireducens]